MRSIAAKGYQCYFDQSVDMSCQGPRPSVQGGIVASMAGGSWLASLVSGYLSDAVGRRRAVMLACLVWVMGCVVTSASQNIPMLIVGRVLNGLCVGVCSAQVPVYISEIAQPSKRGRLTGLQQWAVRQLQVFLRQLKLELMRVADHMGHPNHVLHLLRLQPPGQSHGLSDPMGTSSNSSNRALHRHDLPPRVATMASSPGSMARVRESTDPHTRSWRRVQPMGWP